MGSKSFINYLVLLTTSITIAHGQSVSMTWSDNSDNEDGFTIERKVQGEASFVEIGRVGTNVATYEDSAINQGTTYVYRVRAYNAFGYSGYTNEATAATGEDTTIPDAPASVIIVENRVKNLGNSVASRIARPYTFTTEKDQKNVLVKLSNYNSDEIEITQVIGQAQSSHKHFGSPRVGKTRVPSLGKIRRLNNFNFSEKQIQQIEDGSMKLMNLPAGTYRVQPKF